MNTVYFSNDSTLDIRTITTMGVSVKENDSPIGYFGTGLKYAIAVFLRTGHDIIIKTGGDRWMLALREVTIRDKNFTVPVLLNEEGERELPFTLELGKNWTTLDAYRELHSNTLDENGTISTTRPTANTIITVRGPEIITAYNKRNELFLQTDPIYTRDSIEIHEGKSNHLYYRGIRVNETNYPTKYTYNFLNGTLSEDRILKDVFGPMLNLPAMITECVDRKLLDNILSSGDTHLEGRLDFGSFYISKKPTEQFMQLARKYQHKGNKNPTLAKIVKKFSIGEELYDDETLDHLEQRELKKAFRLLKKLSVTMSRSDFKVSSKLDINILGTVVNKEIIISSRAFTMGHRTIAGTLYEEYLHKEHGLLDCSRGLQNHLLDKLMHEVEKNID